MRRWTPRRFSTGTRLRPHEPNELNTNGNNANKKAGSDKKIYDALKDLIAQNPKITQMEIFCPDENAKETDFRYNNCMKNKLRQIRNPKVIAGKFASIRSSALIFLLGAVLGAFSKWLDNLAYDSTIGWHRFFEMLGLGNVFSDFALWLMLALLIAVYSFNPIKAGINTFLFFAGMCMTYHLYTIFFSGFNPIRYMMIWYTITLVSPLLAAVCWYGKGTSLISIVIDILVLAVLAECCFSMGWFYFGINSIVNAVIFAAAMFVLYSAPKQIIVAGSLGLALAFLMSPLFPF